MKTYIAVGYPSDPFYGDILLAYGTLPTVLSDFSGWNGDFQDGFERITINEDGSVLVNKWFSARRANPDFVNVPDCGKMDINGTLYVHESVWPEGVAKPR